MKIVLDLAKEYNLLKTFEEIHNNIYANEGLSNPRRIKKITQNQTPLKPEKPAQKNSPSPLPNPLFYHLF
jgi:hypothetical protein